MTDLQETDRLSAMWAELKQGWAVLLGCTIGLALGASILLFINGVFVHSFQSEFGWTRSQLSSVNLITVVTVIPLAPVAGLIIDKWGVRLAVGFGMVGLALGFTAIGMMSGSFVQYAITYVITCVLGLLSSSIAFTRAINGVFHNARGLALGLSMAGAGLAATLAPPILAGIIAEEGWRMAFFKLAAAVVLATPATVFLLGLRFSDKRAEGTMTAKPVKGAEQRVPIGAMFADPRFLRLAMIYFFMALGVTGFTFHLMPMLIDKGVSPIEAAKVQALFGVAVIAGRVVLGLLVDHFFAPRVTAVLLSFTTAGIVAMAIGGVAWAPLFAIAIGFTLGMEGDIIGYLTARYFGLDNYGQRYGLFYSAYLLANGCSPLFIALLAERFGGYQTALFACAGCGAIAVVLLATAPRFDTQAKSH